VGAEKARGARTKLIIRIRTGPSYFVIWRSRQRGFVLRIHRGMSSRMSFSSRPPSWTIPGRDVRGRHPMVDTMNMGLGPPRPTVGRCIGHKFSLFFFRSNCRSVLPLTKAWGCRVARPGDGERAWLFPRTGKRFARRGFLFHPNRFEDHASAERCIGFYGTNYVAPLAQLEHR